MATSNRKPVPNDSFETLDQWIPNLQLEDFKNEYLTFASSFNNLQSGLDLSSLSNYDNENNIIENNVDACDSDNSSNKSTQNIEKRLASVQILKLINSYNLSAVFPNLYIAYKYLCTIPATSVS